MRILFTSSDPGSSQQNNAVAKSFKKLGFYIGYITTIINKAYYNEHYNKCYFVEDEISKEKDIISFINEFNPDFIMVGLSVKNNIDYLVCNISKNLNIRTGCIQDYYGYVGNYDTNISPNYIFVFDSYAKRLTDRTNLFDSNNITDLFFLDKSAAEIKELIPPPTII